MSIPVANEIKPERPTLSTQAIHRAATNDPELSENTFTLGSKENGTFREFKVVDLEYDDYLLFITKLAPLMKVLGSSILAAKGGSSMSLDPSSLIEHCVHELPELAALVCRQTDPSVTADEVKKLAKTPFKLATIILRQIEQNKIVSEISDFFAQMLPLMKVALKISK